MAMGLNMSGAGLAAIASAVAFVAAPVSATMPAAILLAILAGRFGRARQFFWRGAVERLPSHQRLGLVLVEGCLGRRGRRRSY